MVGERDWILCSEILNICNLQLESVRGKGRLVATEAVIKTEMSSNFFSSQSNSTEFKYCCLSRRCNTTISSAKEDQYSAGTAPVSLLVLRSMSASNLPSIRSVLGFVFTLSALSHSFRICLYVWLTMQAHVRSLFAAHKHTTMTTDVRLFLNYSKHSF